MFKKSILSKSLNLLFKILEVLLTVRLLVMITGFGINSIIFAFVERLTFIFVYPLSLVVPIFSLNSKNETVLEVGTLLLLLFVIFLDVFMDFVFHGNEKAISKTTPNEINQTFTEKDMDTAEPVLAKDKYELTDQLIAEKLELDSQSIGSKSTPQSAS